MFCEPSFDHALPTAIGIYSVSRTFLDVRESKVSGLRRSRDLAAPEDSNRHMLIHRRPDLRSTEFLRAYGLYSELYYLLIAL